jgi:hypothetical protein
MAFRGPQAQVNQLRKSSSAVVMKRVGETRQLLRRGITDDEYVTVVAILQRMASNLESGLL